MQALGYRSGSSSISHNVDADRHCSLQELLSRPDIAIDFHSTLEVLPKAEKEAHWISEPGFYQLLLKCKLPVAKQLEQWLCQTVLPSLRRTGTYSVSPVEDEPPPKRALEEGLMHTQN